MTDTHNPQDTDHAPTQSQGTSASTPQTALSITPPEDKPSALMFRFKSKRLLSKLIIGIAIAGMLVGTAFAIGGSWSNTFLTICTSASVIVSLIQIDKRQ